MNKIIFIIFAILISKSAFAETMYPIEKYKVKIEPNFKEKSIQGSTEIIFSKPLKNDLEFEISNLNITQVQGRKTKLKFAIVNSKLRISIPKNKVNQSVLITYNGSPTDGLVWGSNYVYTNYEPCTWMICSKSFGLRTSISIDLIIPKDWTATATGNLISNLNLNKDQKQLKWEENNSYSSYLFGFAIGDFLKVEDKYKTIELEYFEPKTQVIDQRNNLIKKFKDTQKIIQFFEEKSGLQLPLKKYSQVVVNEAEAQEKQGVSFLGKSFVDPILTEPSEDWVIVYELAHQWWGNLITCKSLDHFWLNEGIVVFMTAVYKQNNWGQSAYDREMELAKKRYQKAIDSKFDVPPTFAGEYPSLGLKRSIVYSKGALFMDALRKELGEVLFWQGFKDYTLKNQFRSVVTKDFQEAMEKSSGKDLKLIFNKWVY